MIKFTPVRAMAALAICLLASCASLPRSGPSRAEIYDGSVTREGNAYVVKVNDAVNQITGKRTPGSLSSKLTAAPDLSTEILRPGDVISVTIWENVDKGLLSGAAGNSTSLPQLQIDDLGFIFVPYAGRIRAAGNSPEAIRRLITNKLRDQTPDPQVLVQRFAGDGASVTLLGDGGAQSVVPIDRTSRSLLRMIGKAGGVKTSPAGTKITLVRSGHRETVFYQDLLDQPDQDISLRDGDLIIIEGDQRSFIALGAASGQTEVPFTKTDISALEALAQIGGLSSTKSDPTGIFILRYEPETVVRALTGQRVSGPQRIVYVLDLTEPNGMFVAREFMIKDEDTLYVTEAPIVQFNKLISTFTGSLTGVSGAGSAISDLDL